MHCWMVLNEIWCCLAANLSILTKCNVSIENLIDLLFSQPGSILRVQCPCPAAMRINIYYISMLFISHRLNLLASSYKAIGEILLVGSPWTLFIHLFIFLYRDRYSYIKWRSELLTSVQCCKLQLPLNWRGVPRVSLAWARLSHLDVRRGVDTGAWSD